MKAGEFEAKFEAGEDLELLAPRAIVAMGKKAGDIMNRRYTGGRPVYCVPRTNGDRYVSDAAKSVHERMKSELRSHT